jgi:hypothetical protein
VETSECVSDWEHMREWGVEGEAARTCVIKRVCLSYPVSVSVI